MTDSPHRVRTQSWIFAAANIALSAVTAAIVVSFAFGQTFRTVEQNTSNISSLKIALEQQIEATTNLRLTVAADGMLRAEWQREKSEIVDRLTAIERNFDQKLDRIYRLMLRSSGDG